MDRTRAEVAEPAALWAQGRQARRRAQQLRDMIALRRLEREARGGP